MKNPKSKQKKLLIAVIGLWIGIFAIVAVIVGLVLTGTISLEGSDQSAYAPLARFEEGSLANDFELKNLKGENVRLSDLRGKVVVVNFWATWCIPCLEEMPMFQAYSEEYPQFVMLGIDQAESKSKAEPLISKMGITYPILLDTNAKVSDLLQSVYAPDNVVHRPGRDDPFSTLWCDVAGPVHVLPSNARGD